MEPYIYVPMGGENISESVHESLKLSINKGKEIQFDFNGIDMVIDITVSNDSSYWIKEYNAKADERTKKYMESDEYKNRQHETKLELEHKQAVCNEMILRLPEFNINQLDDWMIKFIPLADHIGIKFDSKKVIDALVGFGYVSGEYVGHKGEWTNDMKKRWVYGQVLDGLSRNSIHPALAYRIAEYNQES